MANQNREEVYVIIQKARLSLIFVVILLFFLVGCKSSSLSPGQTLMIFSENMHNGNYTQAAKYVSSLTASEYQMDLPTFLSLIAKEGNPDNISKWTGVEVVSEQIDGSKARVKVKVTVKPDGEETTYDTEIPMTKEDNVWKLHLTPRGYVKE